MTDWSLHNCKHFHHFLDLAARAGVKITAPHEADILQPAPLYGYVDASPMGRKIAVRKLELEQRVTENRNQERQAQANLQHLFGALDNMDYYSSVWMGHRVEKIKPPGPTAIAPSDGIGLAPAQAVEVAGKIPNNGSAPSLHTATKFGIVPDDLAVPMPTVERPE